MAAEEKNTELVYQQGQYGQGYGLELAYGMDLGSTKATLAKEIKKFQLDGEILEEAIPARDYQKLQRLTENIIPNKLNLIESIIEKTQELMIDNKSSIREVKAWNQSNIYTLYNVCSVHRGVFSTSKGYHEYIGGCSLHRGMLS